MIKRLPPITISKKKKANDEFLDGATDIEFMKTLNPTNIASMESFKIIKKSKTELVIPRPRNKFIIYRGLVQKIISKEGVNSLQEISKVTSKVG